MTTDPELDELRHQLEDSAPPGYYVADLWRCRGHCDDVHALVLVDDREAGRAARREAARARTGRGRRRG